MLCLKCCQNLQEIYSLYKNANGLTDKLRQTWIKTKRLNRTRHLPFNPTRLNENLTSSPFPINATDETNSIAIKEEIELEQIPTNIKEQSSIIVSESVLANTPYDLSNNSYIPKQTLSLKMPHQPIDTNYELPKGLKIKPQVNFLLI